jgi:radical SAM protein with 4Fe4S-binding SPASM domain
MGFEGFPLIVGWELTLACNLRCRHCASAAGLPRQGELSLEECLALCDQFPSLLVREVDFTGGEPLLRVGWDKIAAKLGQLGITIRMVTNGLGLSESTVGKMKDVGLKTIAVSVDGLESTHDHIRSLPGMFRQIIQGIERLAAAGLHPYVITAMNNLNASELPSMFQLFHDLGVRAWQLQPILPSGRSCENSELYLSESQYLQLGEFLAEWTPRSKALLPEMRAADSCGYFTELSLGPEWQGCSAGIAAVGIMSDGRVKGCLSMPDELAEPGDLRHNDLWDIWFRPNGFAYTRGFERSALGQHCSGCRYGDQCAGGCSSMSYVATGKFHDDPYCFHAIRCRQSTGAVA